MKNHNEEIYAWLTDPRRTIETGIGLYNKYSSNKNMARLYTHSTDKKLIMSSLDNELRLAAGISPLAVLTPKPAKAAVINEKNTTLQTSPELPEGKTDPFPDESKRPKLLAAIYAEKKELYITVKQYQARLIAMGDQVDAHKTNSKATEDIVFEREALAGQIMKAWDQIEALWLKIDYFNENGKLPDDSPKEPRIKAATDDPIELGNRYRNLCTYISRSKRDPVKHAAKLVEFITELNQVAQLLNATLKTDKYKEYDFETLASK